MVVASGSPVAHPFTIGASLLAIVVNFLCLYPVMFFARPTRHILVTRLFLIYIQEAF